MAYPRRIGRPVGPAWKLLVVVGSEAPLVILRLSLGSSPALLWASIHLRLTQHGRPTCTTSATLKAYMYEYELPKREQLPNEFGAGEECPPKRPNKTRCKAPPIEIPEPFTIMAPYLMVGASSSSWREGVRNTVEAPPAERGLLLRRAPLPVPASLVHCCSLMVQTRLVLPQVALVVVECMFRG